MYVPYWTYDAMTYTRYSGMRGDNYQDDRDLHRARRQRQHGARRRAPSSRTHWYPVSGEVQHFFDDVLVCGSKSIPPHLIDGLEPWDTGELEPFQDAVPRAG